MFLYFERHFHFLDVSLLSSILIMKEKVYYMEQSRVVSTSTVTQELTLITPFQSRHPIEAHKLRQTYTEDMIIL